MEAVKVEGNVSSIVRVVELSVPVVEFVALSVIIAVIVTIPSSAKFVKASNCVAVIDIVLLSSNSPTAIVSADPRFS